MLKLVDPYIVRAWLGLVGGNTTLAYMTHDYWEMGADARIAGYAWVDVSCMTFTLFMASYLLLVWWIIPFFMRNRSPFELRNTILVYDFFMVVMNGYFFVQSARLLDYGREMVKLYDTRGDFSAHAFDYINVANLYYISKLIDLLDTVFMAVRKRYSQISFLHLWHHVSLANAAWWYMKYNPYTPSILIIPFINSFVHMVMYSYYALSSLGPAVHKYLWWKRYITQIQLIQFVTVITWYVYVYFNHQGLSPGYLYCNLGNGVFLLTLFTHFYVQSYRNTRTANGIKSSSDNKIKLN